MSKYRTETVTQFKDKVTLLEVEPAELQAIYQMAQKANALELFEIRQLDSASQMAIYLLIQHRHQLLVKSARKERGRPFKWTIGRPLLVGIHHLLTHSEIMAQWEATMILQLIDKYK